MRDKYLPYAFHDITEEDIQEVIKIIKGNWITMGPKTREFEAAICKYVNCKCGVAVNSGTSALDIAVASLGLKDGEVITTPFTFVATSNAILFNGLMPVFADIKSDTFNINAEEMKKKITERTKAVIYVDYAGQPCDIKEIKEIAEDNNLYLIEDAAHALGAEYNGEKVGGFADITIFSFHPVKHITTGEGGISVTNSEKLERKMRMLRNHGIDKDTEERYGPDATWAYDMKLLGRNYRITDFQAALGISQLKRIESFIKRRQQITKIYNETFEEIPKVTTQHVKPNVRHVWHLYPILLDDDIDRDKFIRLMREKNIGVNVHYIPVYRHDYYRDLGYDQKSFPVSENIFRRIVTLPLFPRMTDGDVLDVIEAVKETIQELKR